MRRAELWASTALVLFACGLLAPGLLHAFAEATSREAVERNAYLHDGRREGATITGSLLDRMTVSGSTLLRSALHNTTVSASELADVTLDNTTLLASRATGVQMVGGAAFDSVLVGGRVEGTLLARTRLCDVFVADTFTYYDRDCRPLRVGGAAAPEAEPLYERGPIAIRSERALCDRVTMYIDFRGRVDGVDDDGVINCITADGSPGRPFRIAGWRITTAGTREEAAILLEGLGSHVVLEDLDVSAPGATALRAADVRNLEVRESVRVQGAAVAYDLSRVQDSRISGVLAGVGIGVLVTASAGVTLAGLRVEAREACVDASGSALAIMDVTATGCEDAFRIAGGPVTLTLNRAYAVATAVRLMHPAPGTEIAHNRFLSVGVAVAAEGDGASARFYDNEVDAATAFAGLQGSAPAWYVAPTPGLNILGGGIIAGNAWHREIPAGDLHPLQVADSRMT